MSEKYTVETYAKAYNLTRQSAINKLSELKKDGYIAVSGGGAQKRIYTLSVLKKKPTNGFFNLVNKYSPEKLVPKFEHYVYGRYTIEMAIIDGLKQNDSRTRNAVIYLFRNITDWKKLFELAKKNNLVSQLYDLYDLARKTTKCKKIPKRYEQ